MRVRGAARKNGGSFVDLPTWNRSLYQPTVWAHLFSMGKCAFFVFLAIRTSEVCAVSIKNPSLAADVDLVERGFELPTLSNLGE